VRVAIHASGHALLDRAGAFLEAREAENALVIGLCRELGDSGSHRGQPAFLCTVERAGAVEAVALRTPPMSLVVTRLDRETAGCVVDALRGASLQVPGVVGPEDAARTFAEAWCGRTGEGSVVHMRQGLYELRRVIPAPPTAGFMRAATASDAERIDAWSEGFARDAGLPAEEHPAARQAMAGALGRGEVVVWDDQGPVTMAATRGRTRNGIRVAYVYTPAPLRRRGYASALVAALSAKMLDAGCAFCMLYTDLDNPTSNHVYQRVGYEPIGTSAMIRFTS
jgi:uncharacterized protein